MNSNFNDLVDLVKREAKGTITENEKMFLNNNLRLWAEGLDAAIDDADDQFDLQKDKLDRVRADVSNRIRPAYDYDEALEFHEAWSKKASRYRIGLDQRSREVRALIRAEYVKTTDHAQYGLALLEAVTAHRTQKYDQNMDGDEIDQELWLWLDERVDKLD